ncbi:acyl-CoA dehydrogenase family protein [Herbiconiux ginsengi]|uniref:3-hydroxy-9,10-secoandrosta-1,3,5(10)-triene-9,17-dione monooxygenase n=1 Tax=Herbiconiux ginsengi TaxID=381665 RepID=A0A1H3LML3_9MICO|nr:acyl-CoA dehydrogenase family protein [Herbiconiux ginsengi]SDY65787.1 3-hydroxy-9,10-secoandrosta-1,3,5(10)-triene-9,17-dione monooxygenase [Herbiconiux ginsengi]
MNSPATVQVTAPRTLTFDQALENARSLHDRVLTEAEETERNARHSEGLHQAFLEAGFYHLLRPKTFGGYEFTLPQFLRVMREIARADMATAWCLTLASGHNLQVASFWGEKAQRQVFSGEYFAAPMTSAPAGKLTRVEGGFIVDGVHRYASGVPYSTHFCGHAFHDDREGVISTFIAPRESYTILDDWGGTLGLRGSGSNSVEFVNAFIPEEFVLEGVTQITIDAATQAHGRLLHGNPMYGAPGMGFFSLELNSLALGAALALFDEYETQMITRRTVTPPFGPRMEDTFFQWRYGTARAKLDAAVGTMDHAGAMFDEALAAMDTTPFSREVDLRIGLVAGESARLLWAAVSDFLFKSIGSSAVVSGTRPERIWRDLSQWWSHLNTQLSDPLTTMYAASHFESAKADA